MIFPTLILAFLVVAFVMQFAAPTARARRRWIIALWTLLGLIALVFVLLVTSLRLGG